MATEQEAATAATEEGGRRQGIVLKSGVIGSHKPPSKAGCAAYLIFLHIHKLILKAAFGKQLVVMCN